MDSTLIFQLLLSMVLILFVVGLITTVIGIVILILRVAGRDVRTLAIQTTKLAQKGLAEEVVGLVGNASSLLDALNHLVRTTAGVGVFLTLLGIIIIGSACWLALQIY